MKLAIEISEKVVNDIKDRGSIYYTDVSEVIKAIVNGKPLPKGHGRLIDGNVLLNKWDNMSVGRSEFDQVIMCAPTIIEADKESEE